MRRGGQRLGRLLQRLVIANALGDDQFRAFLLHEQHVPRASVVVSREHLAIAVVAVQVVHHHRDAERPADRARATAEPAVRDADERRSLGEPAIRRLVGEILQGLRIERPHVEVEDEGFGRGRDIGPVPEPLARGAVGLHTEKVAQKRLATDAVNVIEQRAGAFELTGIGHGGGE